MDQLKQHRNKVKWQLLKHKIQLKAIRLINKI